MLPRVGGTAASMAHEEAGEGHGDGKFGALSLSPGNHENPLDSKVTPREVNAQW